MILGVDCKECGKWFLLLETRVGASLYFSPDRQEFQEVCPRCGTRSAYLVADVHPPGKDDELYPGGLVQ